MSTRKDRNETDASHESTWGTSPEAKAAWDRKHGAAARKAAKDDTTSKEDDK